jgi:hypothetical protein
MKRGGGTKGLDDKSNGMEILISKNLIKITLHAPLRQSAEEEKRGKELRVL